jgi:hypothetical protein
VLPTAFEFRWDAGHMIFFGLFYAVVVVILTSLSYVVVKSMVDVYRSMKMNQPPVDNPEPKEEVARHAPEPVIKV